ncbi:MAG: DUF4116 domain-containing protein [Pseudomonadota bacterium]|nr:DUF4116 domain-containing protein [Pseudomonadota bacterium]
MALELISKNGYNLKNFPEFQDDRDIVFEAVKKDGTTLAYASEELRSNREFVLEAMKENPRVSKYSLLDKEAIKELMQKLSIEVYISKEAYKISLFDTTSKKDGSMIEQNEVTLSKILSYFSITDASRLSQVSKKINSSIEFNF